jgi:hypothetical protein
MLELKLTIGAKPAYFLFSRANLFSPADRDRMGILLPFVRGQSVFDPEALRAMSAALDQACHALSLPETAARERETVAVRIVELARRGERDPERLCERVLHDAGSR